MDDIELKLKVKSLEKELIELKKTMAARNSLNVVLGPGNAPDTYYDRNTKEELINIIKNK